MASGCKSSGSGTPADGGDSGLASNCPVPDDLISNFDVDNSIAAVDGRQGGWYTYGDMLGSFATPTTGYRPSPPPTPTPPAAEGSSS